jgi:hypothetical protein
MADAAVGVVADSDNATGTPEFGLTAGDCTVSGAYTVGAYIVGGSGSVQGEYDVNGDGTVTQFSYPGL